MTGVNEGNQGTAALVLGAGGGLAQAIISELMADAGIDTVIAVSRNAAPEHFATGPATPVWIETEYSEPAMAAVVEQLQPFAGRIGRGSKVRLLWAEGQPHPVHGTSTYLNKIKVLEVAEQEGGEDF